MNRDGAGERERARESDIYVVKKGKEKIIYKSG